MKMIVLGVDGSETAKEALTLAAREAELHDARLRIVVVWQLSSLVYGGGFVAFDEETYGALRDRAQSVADAAGAAVAELAPEVDYETVVLEGQPAEALLGASEDADLVVVGSRGLGGFKRLMLGSVSDQVVHHAACPVLVVHPKA
jgi:nucleotide-binding universal stress UspA family protein